MPDAKALPRVATNCDPCWGCPWLNTPDCELLRANYARRRAGDKRGTAPTCGHYPPPAGEFVEPHPAIAGLLEGLGLLAPRPR